MPVSVDLVECRPLTTWKPLFGDFLIVSNLFSTWYGLVTEIDNINETVTLVYAASPKILFGMSPSQRTKRKKVLDIQEIKDSSSHTVVQNYGGKSVWYLR